MPRPPTLVGETIKTLTPFGVLFATINHTENGIPYEVFLRIGKAGSDIYGFAEGYGRLISLYLGSGGRLEKIVDQLKDIGGSRTIIEDGSRIHSLPDAIAISIQTYIQGRLINQ